MAYPTTRRNLFVAALLLFFLSDVGLQSFAQSNPSVAHTSAFEEDFDVMWATDHVKSSADGRMWNLVLDQNSGSGFQSKGKFKYGWFSMKLKLVPGDSAGVVTAYYLSSNTENRDELDFEFLGNRSGEPYVLQTNMYVNGVGGREQRMNLWFDPTQKFHTYSILWNTHNTVFYVDQVPIRVHRNTPQTRAMYPTEQPMYIFSSIWNGDGWATRGGLDKINWEAAPFVSAYEKFHVDACEWSEMGDVPACAATTSQQWWDRPFAWTLTEKEKASYKWATSKFMQYNYCTDVARYATPPAECVAGLD
ncbi:hypothetical protein L7F22_053763 [Adiantum nelumboides]|nr:hypothetical protein [Adiantum nelumboides]